MRQTCAVLDSNWANFRLHADIRHNFMKGASGFTMRSMKKSEDYLPMCSYSQYVLPYWPLHSLHFLGKSKRHGSTLNVMQIFEDTTLRVAFAIPNTDDTQCALLGKYWFRPFKDSRAIGKGATDGRRIGITDMSVCAIARYRSPTASTFGDALCLYRLIGRR